MIKRKGGRERWKEGSKRVREEGWKGGRRERGKGGREEKTGRRETDGGRREGGSVLKVQKSKRPTGLGSQGLAR